MPRVGRPPNTEYAVYYNGSKLWYLSKKEIRTIWEHISSNPMVSRHELAEITGFSVSKVQAIVHLLNDGGHISLNKDRDAKTHKSRAIKVNVPLVSGVAHKINKLENE